MTLEEVANYLWETQHKLYRHFQKGALPAFMKYHCIKPRYIYSELGWGSDCGKYREANIYSGHRGYYRAASFTCPVYRLSSQI